MKAYKNEYTKAGLVFKLGDKIYLAKETKGFEKYGELLDERNIYTSLKPDELKLIEYEEVEGNEVSIVRVNDVLTIQIGHKDMQSISDIIEKGDFKNMCLSTVDAANESCTEQIALAEQLAIKHHAGQLYGTKEYMSHVNSVVDILKKFGHTRYDFIASAFLHDTIEDCSITEDDLLKGGVDKIVTNVVNLLTDEPGETRQERKAKTLSRIATNDIAIIVKLADRIANVEAGSKNDMYKEEHKAFKEALFVIDSRTDKMWAYLDAMLGFVNLDQDHMCL